MTELQKMQSMMQSRIDQLSVNDNVYWSVGDQIARSKFDAMGKLSNGVPTNFYFHDKEWAEYNWADSSSSSMEQLMIARAREIRHNNSYVRLSYSGGADSHTVLTAFKLAGVAPDEIYFWTMLGEYKTIFDNNFEINRAVIPYLPVIQSWFPKTKIRHINLNYDRYRALKLLDPSHAFFEISTGLRSFTTSLSLATFDDFDITPNAITISGSDKPRLDYINGHWYAWITDVGSMHAWGRNIEGFFQSADPTIYIKQCHAIKEYLKKQIPNLNRKAILQIQNSRESDIRQGINDALGRYTPFDRISLSRKQTQHRPGLGENGIKAYCLWRTIRNLPDGRDFLKQWEEIKSSFNKDTGYCPTIEVFGKFYNLDTGKIYTVDELFPNGWNLD